MNRPNMYNSDLFFVIAIIFILFPWNTEFVQCEDTSPVGDVNSASPEAAGEASSSVGQAAVVTLPATVDTDPSLSTLLESSTLSSLPLLTSPLTSQILPDFTTTLPTTFIVSSAAAATSQTQGEGQSTEVISSSPSATSSTLVATSTAAITSSPAVFSSSSTSSNIAVTSVPGQIVTSPPVSGVTTGPTSLLNTTATGEVQTYTTSSQTSTWFVSTLNFLQSTAILSSNSQQPISDISQTQSYVISTVTMAASSVTSEHAGPANQVLAIVLGVVLGVAFVVAVLSIGLCCCVRQQRKNRKSDKGRLADGDAETGQNCTSQEPMKVKVNHKQENKDATFIGKSDEQNHDPSVGDSSDNKQKTLKSRVISFKNAIRKSLAGSKSISQEVRQPVSHTSTNRTADVIIASTEDLSLAVPRGTDILVNYKKAQPPRRKPAGRDALRRQTTADTDNDDINIVTTESEENNENDITITVL